MNYLLKRRSWEVNHSTHGDFSNSDYVNTNMYNFHTISNRWYNIHKLYSQILSVYNRWDMRYSNSEDFWYNGISRCTLTLTCYSTDDCVICLILEYRNVYVPQWRFCPMVLRIKTALSGSSDNSQGHHQPPTVIQIMYVFQALNTQSLLWLQYHIYHASVPRFCDYSTTVRGITHECQRTSGYAIIPEVFAIAIAHVSAVIYTQHLLV